MQQLKEVTVTWEEVAAEKIRMWQRKSKQGKNPKNNKNARRQHDPNTLLYQGKRSIWFADNEKFDGTD